MPAQIKIEPSEEANQNLRSVQTLSASTPIKPRGYPFRALLTVSAARSLLNGSDEDDVIDLVESKRIAVAFNISLGAQDRRREIRIMAAALESFQRGDKFDWEWSNVKAELFSGYGLDWITALDMRLLLNCSSTHANELITIGRLALASGSVRRPGPKGSPRVLLESFCAWLKRRLL